MFCIIIPPGNIGTDAQTRPNGMADSIGTASANFLLGTLIGVNYLGPLDNGSVTISLVSGGLGYTYIDPAGRQLSSGIITASRAPVVTPEPSSLLLFGTGALGIAAFGARKFAA